MIRLSCLDNEVCSCNLYRFFTDAGYLCMKSGFRKPWCLRLVVVAPHWRGNIWCFDVSGPSSGKGSKKKPQLSSLVTSDGRIRLLMHSYHLPFSFSATIIHNYSSSLQPLCYTTAQLPRTFIAGSGYKAFKCTGKRQKIQANCQLRLREKKSGTEPTPRTVRRKISLCAGR